MKQRKISGTQFPITDDHAGLVDRHFGEDWPDLETVKHHTQGLMIASEDRELTEAEHEKLRACDAIVNMHRVLRVLNGRDHTEVFPHLDQLHGNMVGYACGCHLVHFFDHHAEEKTVFVPHTPRRKCARHSGFSDHVEHYKAVVAEHTVVE